MIDSRRSTRPSSPAVAVAASLAFLSLAPAACAQSEPAVELAGIWSASRSFGPELRGPLEIGRTVDGWWAECSGIRAQAPLSGDEIALTFPGERGSFHGRVGPSGIEGHWTQPKTANNGLSFASPVRLAASGPNRWLGEIVPWDDGFTFHLVLSPREDGTLGAFFRNPERNLGVFLNLDRLERDGDRVRLIGSWLRNTDERVLAEGVHRPGDEYIPERLSIYIPRGGGTYEFERIDADPASTFYARGAGVRSYDYRPPPQLDDGWAVGTLEDAGIAIEPIRRLIETEILPVTDSLHDLYVHGMLIARGGRLVLEEYFHGFDRWTPHETRSASKSLTSTFAGAAIQAGEPLALSTPVRATALGDGADTADARWQRMTLEHLLTMSSGLDCDDRDPESPGAEDVMQEQTEEPDWYRYTLALGMLHEPGDSAVYCSINPNLAGLVLSETAGEPLAPLFERLIAEPLGVERYHLVLQPTGEPYMGGGIYWLPRDFMKLGQLYLDGGLWNGKRLLSEEFVERAVSPLYELRERRYGYLWWLMDYPYGEGTVRAFFAGGNGGQVVIGIPELDLLLAFYAGNYNDRVMFRIQEELVRDYILPALAAGEESG
jgi:CubicO group peptidase (beta-lactamase class C family)